MMVNFRYGQISPDSSVIVYSITTAFPSFATIQMRGLLSPKHPFSYC